MSAQIFIFTRAAMTQPTTIAAMVHPQIPPHAVAGSLEVIAWYYTQMVKHWDLITADAETRARETNEMAVAACTLIGEVTKYGKYMFKDNIVPASVYAATLAEMLGEGKTEACPWTNPDAVTGFGVMLGARALDLKNAPPAYLGESYREYVVTRQLLLIRDLDKLSKKLTRTPVHLRGKLDQYQPFNDATQTVWPPSPLSAWMAILATRIRRSVEDKAAPRLKSR